jgi:putative ABC transport system substrate-binding protein
MAIVIPRRKFLAALGGAAVPPSLWPFAARTQTAKMPVVGWLNGGAPKNYAEVEAAFRDGLRQQGFAEGVNVAFDYRWAEGQYDRLPALAAELVRARVAAIFASSSGAAVAAKSATTTIPVVFAGASDPVQLGLVPSLNRPGGNITGATMYSHVLSGKRLELLRQLAPHAVVLGILVNRSNPSAETELQSLQAATHGSGWETAVFDTRTAKDIDSAFATFAQRNVGAGFVVGDPLFTSRRDQILELAARYAIPASYPLREFVLAGGLLSYGTSFNDAARNCGVYVGRILKGEKAADLPVVLPTKFALVINLKTAKALGVTIPPTLLALADEVIE